MRAHNQPLARASLLREAEQGLQGECLGMVGQELQPGQLR